MSVMKTKNDRHRPENALDLRVQKAVGEADYKALGGQKGRPPGLRRKHYKKDVSPAWRRNIIKK